MKSFSLGAAFIFGVLCLSYVVASATEPGAPTSTRIIDSFSQLGIDSPAPRFGWVVNDPDRGERQTAYQILVAKTEQGIEREADLEWDSGKVISGEQYGITYAGQALIRTTKYWWKVRTWDKDGNVSPWSAKNSFVTAFFALDEWAPGIQWIRHPAAISGGAFPNNPPPMFRKGFTVTKPVKHAYFYICGLGQFVGFLNGTKIGDHELDPAWTSYDVTANYVTFDITSLLRQGHNALGVMLGNGWYAYPGTRRFGPMRVWAQLHLEFTDGTSTELVTDSSWKASFSPCTQSEVHGAEFYDGRLEQPGWNTLEFDDVAWTNAVAAVQPIGALASQNAPPVVVREVVRPVKVTHPAPNIVVYDFGKNMNGVYQFTVSGDAGALVQIQTAESLAPDGRASTGGRGEPTNYTLRGGGPEAWRLAFSSIGFRYLEFRGVAASEKGASQPRINDVTAYFISSAARELGSFKSSDHRYEQIHDLALRTIQSNMCSIHTDGPNHERLGWQEVVWLNAPSMLYCHEASGFLSKIMHDVRDGQRTCGLCPSIVPNWFVTTQAPPGNNFDDAPAWGSSIFIAPWTVYQTYGDTKILKDNYETMKRYLAYLKTREVNGLVVHGLGDWMAPAGSPVGNVEGAVYVFDTGLLRDIATVLGKTDDAALYRSEYERVRAAYNRAYFNSATQSYQPMNQTNQAMPLVFGLVPTGSEQAVLKALLDNIEHPQETGPPASEGRVGDFGPILPFHVTAGDIGVVHLWRALGDAGKNDLVQTMIMQPTEPSYMNMINSGETAITENWHLSKARSHNHDMYAGILEWFYRSLAGISPLKPGYEVIQIKPSPPRGLKSVSASYDSVRGMIKSAWESDDSVFKLSIQVPVNARAIVHIPTSERNSVEQVVSVGQKADALFVRIEGSAAVFEVGSGDYVFRSTLP